MARPTLTAVVLIILAVAGLASGLGTTVMTSNGPIKGLVKDTVTIFRGVPFAAPPVGDLRFKPPQEPTPWTDPITCDKEFQLCPQLDAGKLFVGSEDCLYLDVYVPEGAGEAGSDPLPVMAWLFGGGFVFGDKYEFGFYDGVNVASKHNVILVNINYRLGPFGYFALDELMAESNTTGNYGLQDQTLALQWIQNNAAAFGGNPDQVMLYGESAGAFSTCWHLVSPASAGLFDVALMESTTCDSPLFYRPMEEAQNFTLEWAARAGCSDSSDMLSCIRGLSASELMDVEIEQGTAPWIPKLSPVMPWAMAIDGSPQGLVDVPLNLLKSGAFNKVPVIAGTNQDEGSILLFMLPKILKAAGVHLPLNEETSDITMDFFFDKNVTAEIYQLYSIGNYHNDWDKAATAILTDYFFVCATQRALAAIGSHGVFTANYEFVYEAWIDDKILGDYHSSELEFVWDNAWPPIVHAFDDDDKAMAASFGTYWTNFAKFMDPNGNGASGQPNWPTWNDTTYHTMVLDVPPYVESDYKAEKCKFWNAQKP